MGERTVPAVTVYTCDACPVEYKVSSEKQKKPREIGWAMVIIAANTMDRNVAVGDASERLLFCPKCREAMLPAIDRKLHELRSEHAT